VVELVTLGKDPPVFNVLLAEGNSGVGGSKFPSLKPGCNWPRGGAAEWGNWGKKGAGRDSCGGLGSFDKNSMGRGKGKGSEKNERLHVAYHSVLKGKNEGIGRHAGDIKIFSCLG